MLVPSEHDKPMFGLPSNFIFHYMCRTPARVKMPSAETGCQEKADWDHGTMAMVSIKLYRSHAEKSAKGWSDEFMFLEPRWAHEGSWGCFREEKKNFSNHEMLGEYKTENRNKPLMDLIWACVPDCLILVQKFSCNLSVLQKFTLRATKTPSESSLAQ